MKFCILAVTFFTLGFSHAEELTKTALTKRATFDRLRAAADAYPAAVYEWDGANRVTAFAGTPGDLARRIGSAPISDSDAARLGADFASAAAQATSPNDGGGGGAARKKLLGRINGSQCGINVTTCPNGNECAGNTACPVCVTSGGMRMCDAPIM